MRIKATIKRATLQKLYIDDNLSAAEVARQIKCSTSTVRRYIEQYGLYKVRGEKYAARYGRGE